MPTPYAALAPRLRQMAEVPLGLWFERVHDIWAPGVALSNGISAYVAPPLWE